MTLEKIFIEKMSFIQLFHKLMDEMSDKKIKKELELNQSIQ